MTLNETLKDWFTTFWKILISPTPKTFIAESQKAKGKFPGAVAWLVFLSVYIFIFSIFVLGQVMITGLIELLLVIPLTMILFTSTMNFMYRRVFRRKQRIYDELIYLNTAILVSIQILFVPLSTFFLIPTSSITVNAIISDVVLFYQLILVMIAFMSIASLDFWQAAITVTASVFVTGIVLVLTIPIVFSVIG